MGNLKNRIARMRERKKRNKMVLVESSYRFIDKDGYAVCVRVNNYSNMPGYTVVVTRLRNHIFESTEQPKFSDIREFTRRVRVAEQQ